MTDPYDAPTDDTPFRVLVLADLSGRACRGAREVGRELSSRKAITVDRDDFERVMARVAPRLQIRVSDGIGDVVSLEFSELDDFHPDRIVLRCPLFRALRDLRARLDDPSSFEGAVDELRATVGVDIPLDEFDEDSSTETLPRSGVSAEELLGADFMDQVLSRTKTREREEDWDALVKEIAGPALARVTVPGRRPRQDECVRSVDEVAAAQLRRILHDPAFQALETTWRALFLLVRRVETGPLLEISVLDVSKDEVAEDLALTAQAGGSGLHRIVVDRTVGTPGATPWSLLVVDASFDAVQRDVALLVRLVKMARAAGVAVAAGADGRLVGCPDVGRTPYAADWTHTGDPKGREMFAALRRLPEASLVALAWPRFLVRQPYGADADPTEEFPFEEIDSAQPMDPARFLWANGAWALALTLCRGYAERGWSFLRGFDPQIGGLPVHTYDDDGDPEILPCAEAWVTIDDAEIAADRGALVLLSVKNDGAVRLAHLNSLALPRATLVGRWN
jgi:type VI secretion system protein ImpC